jgi:hypothetical protein
MSLHFTSFIPPPISLAIPISQKNENGSEISGMHASRERDAHLHNIHATGRFFRGKGGISHALYFYLRYALTLIEKGGRRNGAGRPGVFCLK